MRQASYCGVIELEPSSKYSKYKWSKSFRNSTFCDAVHASGYSLLWRRGQTLWNKMHDRRTLQINHSSTYAVGIFRSFGFCQPSIRYVWIRFVVSEDPPLLAWKAAGQARCNRNSEVLEIPWSYKSNIYFQQIWIVKMVYIMLNQQFPTLRTATSSFHIYT